MISTPRLSIRFINENDWHTLIEIWEDFDRSEYAQYDVPHTTGEAEVREKTAQWAHISPEREHMFFAVCKEESMIGYIDFHRTVDGYERGYCFHSRYQGKGYAKESLLALMHYLSEGKALRFTVGTALLIMATVNLLRFPT